MLLYCCSLIRALLLAIGRDLEGRRTEGEDILPMVACVPNQVNEDAHGSSVNHVRSPFGLVAVIHLGDVGTSAHVDEGNVTYMYVCTYVRTYVLYV